MPYPSRRTKIVTMNNVQKYTDWLSYTRNSNPHRQMVLVSLPLEDALGYLYATIDSTYSTCVVSREFCIADTNHIELSRYQDFLGQQTHSLIFDARNGFHLNAFYGCVGMVQAKGVIVVLLPNSPHYNQDKMDIKFSYGYLPKQSYFNQFFVSLAHQHKCAFISQSTQYFPNEQNDALHSVKQTNTKFVGRKALNKEHVYHNQKSTLSLSKTQQGIKTNIVNRISQHEHSSSISIILGPRGRGKSTLLGYIAESLLQVSSNQGVNLHNYLAVSALSKKQLNQFFAVYQECSTHYALDTCDVVENVSDNSERIAFFSLDEITLRAPKNAIVIIDEIACVAPQLLRNIVDHFSHCIISGTNNGYEGSGKGFIHRVLPSLNNTKQVDIYKLNTPFRWLDNDPVELFLDQLICTSKVLDVSHALSQTSNANLQFCKVDKADLVEDENLYHQVFTILSEAHYQTSPNDIVRILDAPDCNIVIAYIQYELNSIIQTKVIGVAVVIEEGSSILDGLAHFISIGKRRVQGHLTPQALAYNLLLPALCSLRYHRINRIAVCENYKHNGIGSQLLTYCEALAKQQNIDYMSVSYGYTSQLHRFWTRNKYCLAKLGYRIDTASGTSSVLLLKRLNDIADTTRSSIDLSISPLIEFLVFVEYQFIKSTNKRLQDLYKPLFNNHTKSINETNEIVVALINRTICAYLDKNIDIVKVSPILFWYLSHHKGNDTSGLYEETIQMLLNYAQKGMHKEQRVRLANDIFKATCICFKRTSTNF